MKTEDRIDLIFEHIDALDMEIRDLLAKVEARDEKIRSLGSALMKRNSAWANLNKDLDDIRALWGGVECPEDNDSVEIGAILDRHHARLYRKDGTS